MTPRAPTAVVLLALLTLTGCITPGPDYEPPAAVELLPTETPAPAYAIRSEVLSDWWSEFHDERLNGLVAEALRNNRDLRAAASNLQAARANLSLARLERLPTDSLSASAGRLKQSGAAAGVPAGIPDIFEPTDTFSVAYAPQWDLDLFGRISRQIEIDTANLEAQAEQLRNLQLIVIGDVATAYFDLQAAYLERGIVARNLSLQQDSLRLTQVRYDKGRGTEVDVLNARAQLDSTRASLPDLVARSEQLLGRLAVLVGVAPGELDERLAGRSDAQFIDRPLAVGTLEDLVRRQPAVRGAERELAASVSEIGLNISSLFPTLTLSGNLGVSAADANRLDSEDAITFSIGPTLSWSPLGVLRGRQRVAASRARSSSAFANYENQVLRALEDLRSALALQRAARERRPALLSALQASREAARIAAVQFEYGAVAFEVVLDAEARLLERDLAASRNEYDIIAAQIAVFRALGAG